MPQSARRCLWCPPADSRRSASHRRFAAAQTSTSKPFAASSRPATSAHLASAFAPDAPLTDADTATSPRVVVVNRSFVASFLDNIPIERAIGMSLGPDAVRSRQGQSGSDDRRRSRRPEAGPPRRPVTAGNVRVLRADARAATTGSRRRGGSHQSTIRSRYVEALRTTIREEDPSLALDAVMTMDQRVGESLSRPRMYAVLFLGFAAFALVIAGAGLFGVLSQTRVATIARAGRANRSWRQPRDR